VLQVAVRKRDAACGRSKPSPRDVNEYGAAVPGDARALVMVDFDDQIVKSIGTF
jgi:hypothetical protein